MINEAKGPLSEADLTVHALRMASAITANASEPADVIANTGPIAAWLADDGDGPEALSWRLIAAYQQLDNQRGASSEVGRFLERAQELYVFLHQMGAGGPGGDE